MDESQKHPAKGKKLDTKYLYDSIDMKFQNRQIQSKVEKKIETGCVVQRAGEKTKQQVEEGAF